MTPTSIGTQSRDNPAGTCSRAGPRRLVFLSVTASYAHSNLAAWRLRAGAEAAGWLFQEVEALAAQPPNAVLRRVMALQPDALAATFYLFNRLSLQAILRRFKSLRPDCPILGGGPEFLGDNRPFLERNPEIDAVIRGEGERGFEDWLRRMGRPDLQDRIPGLCRLNGNRYVDNGTAETAAVLDAFPSPYPAALAEFRKPFVLLETARGCSNRCAFCTSGAGGPVRRLSLGRARRDLQFIRDSGVPEVRLVDRTFNERPSHYRPLLRCLRDEFKTLRVHLEIDPALVTDALVDELAAAEPGRFHLEIGIQTLDPAVLQAIGRRGAAARSLAGLCRLCALRNLETHADLIAGLPRASLAGLFDDLRALVRAGPDIIQIEPLKLLPGTRLAAERDRWGLVASPEPPYEILQTGAQTFEELETASRLSRAVDRFYNPPELHPVAAEAARRLPRFWEDLVAFAGDALAEPSAPSLENRFRTLDNFLAGRLDGLRHALHYAWLKHGFSAQHGLSAARPWKGPLPGNAVLVEGRPAAGGVRIFAADLDQRYAFVYARQRPAAAIYRLPPSEGSNLHRLLPKSLDGQA